jgi:cell division septum initiation protein DivIVA
VTDNRMKGRVRGLFSGPSPENELPDQMHDPTDPDARQALQVLMLAQRTADDHVATAQHQAERIRADARATAEQIAREAQAHADDARRESDKALSDARARAEQMDRDAQAYAEDARRESDKALAEAQARAEQRVQEAQAHAEGLEREAEQRYEEALGGLSAKREALQQQVEELQQFDREYRERLRTFMEGQLRELGVNEPASAKGEAPAPRGEAVQRGPVATGRRE